MDRVFNSDNKFFRGLSKIIDCVIVSACWVLCNLPVLVITAISFYAAFQGDFSVTVTLMPASIIFAFLSGPANAALYYVCVKNIKHNHSYPWKEFWHGFKDSFKQATVACFIVFIILVVLIFDVLYLFIDYYQMSLGPLVIICLVVLLLILMWLTNIFSYAARFEDNTKTILKNSAIIGFVNLPKSFIQAILLLIAAAACGVAPICLFFMPAVYTLSKSLLMEKTFRKYMSEEDIAEEDERNREEK